jgi:hypothetical protein
MVVEVVEVRHKTVVALASSVKVQMAQPAVVLVVEGLVTHTVVEPEQYIHQVVVL